MIHTDPFVLKLFHYIMKTMTQKNTKANTWDIIQLSLISKIQNESIGGEQN